MIGRLSLQRILVAASTSASVEYSIVNPVRKNTPVVSFQ